MAIASTRTISVGMTGDSLDNVTLADSTNVAAPGGSMVPVALSSGNNTIAVPAGSQAVTVAKPAGNAVALVWKGVAGDTGHKLNLTGPDSISLDPTQTTIVINAASAVTVHLTWS